MLELAACQSAQVQAVLAREAWASSSSSDASVMVHSKGSSKSGLWLDLFREKVANGVQLVGLCNRLTEIVVAACAQLTPSRAPDLVFVAEVRDCAMCPLGRRLSSPFLVHQYVVE